MPPRLHQTRRPGAYTLVSDSSPPSPPCPQAPEICDVYVLNVSPTAIRHAIRERFERNRHVTDPRAIDILLLKGRQEYQETMNCWKLNDHVLGILLEPKDRPQKSFLERFYEGVCLFRVLLAG